MPLVDFAIITGLEEEWRYLKSVIEDFQEDETRDDNEVWYHGRIRADNDRAYSIVGSFQTDMGPQHANALTAKVIHRWDPAYIVLVGIAGSFKKDVRLGHVIVSVQIFFFDPGKATEIGIEYRPEGYPCSSTLVRHAKALASDRNDLAHWRHAGRKSAAAKAKAAERKRKNAKRSERKTRKRVRGKRTSSLQELRSHIPEVHFGTIASGSLVIASKRMQARLLTLHGKIIGTEMEGAGMLAQTFTQERPTPCIVIKGISDHADPDKAAADEEQYWRELGTENASRLLLTLLRRGRIQALHTDEFDLDITRGTADQTLQMIPDLGRRGDAYLGFPWLVLPKGPITQLSIEIHAIDQSGNSLPIHKLVVKYTCIEGKPRLDLPPPSETVTLSRLSAYPVQLYLLVGGTPGLIHFRANTPAESREIEWRPPS